MTTTNYVYTLQDLYKMFQQADASEKVQLLTEWSGMNLPYQINWEKIIQRNMI